MPSIKLIFSSGDPESVPEAILADLLNSRVWGKGSSRRPWSHALKEIGARPAHIGALRILTLPDREGNIPLGVDGVDLSQDLAGTWQLTGGSQVYRGIRHALQVIRMV